VVHASAAISACRATDSARYLDSGSGTSSRTSASRRICQACIFRVTGKTIRIFLADGEPTGILLAEISNWTGKVLVAPRSQLDQISKREEVRRTGVYLLVGPDPDDPSRALASIGEGDNVLKRLVAHDCAAHCHPTLLLTP